MSMFEAKIPREKLAAVEREIERRIEAKKKKFGDVQATEKEAIGDLLDYGRAAVDDISHDHYIARKFVKMFPERDVAAGEAMPSLPVRFYHKVVRRLLRQQIVFNESVLGFLEETEQRVSELERRLKDLEAGSSRSGRSS